MIANKTVNQGFLAKLPAAPKGAVTFPTMTQVNTAKARSLLTGLRPSAVVNQVVRHNHV